MIKEITFSTFCDEFINSGRSNDFSYKGKKVLFNHLESLEEELGSQIELDIVGICCEYAEENLASVLSTCGLDTLEELEKRTRVLNVDGTNIIYEVY